MVTRALAERLLFEGGRCVGVAYRTPAGRRAARAGGEVVVSAGAIGSPALLMRSGIGPAEFLAGTGIAVIAPSPQVGRNLQEHAGVGVGYGVNVPTISADARGLGAARTAMRWALTRSGAAAMSCVNVSGFVRSDGAPEPPDVQIQFVPMGYDDTGDQPRLSREERVNFTINPCRPLSRGAIRIRSPDPDDPPVIDHRLLGAEADIATLRAGVEVVRRLARAPSLAPLIQAELFPGRLADRAEDFAAFARATCFNQMHPTSTCAMGGEGAVLDPQLRVRGVQGLRVADASAMPAILSGNTNAASVMIGERVADFILR